MKMCRVGGGGGAQGRAFPGRICPWKLGEWEQEQEQEEWLVGSIPVKGRSFRAPGLPCILPGVATRTLSSGRAGATTALITVAVIAACHGVGHII